MNLNFLRLGIFVGLCSIVLVAILYSDQLHRRYSGYICQYRIIHDYEGSVDVATFGTSRMQEAVNARMLKLELEEALPGHNEINVFDLSKSGHGHSQITQFAIDLVRNRDVRFLIIEFKNWKKAKVHHRFVESAPWSRVFSDIRFPLNYGTYYNELSSKTNFIMRKSKERFLKNFKAIAEDGLGYFIPPKKKKSKSWSDCSPRLGTFAAPDRLYEWNKTHRNWHSDEPLYWDIKDPKLVRGNFYSKQLIKLAKEYKVEPIFVYVPASNERLLDPKMKSEFENFFGTKLLSVDAETSKKLYATGYANKTHMNLSGQKIFAEWLSNQLKGLY